MNILVPSAGKRYLHIRYIKEAKGVNKVVTTEISSLAPAIHAADICYQVPRIMSPNYLDAIMKICLKESIDLIIPLMDADIVIFSRNRKIFEGRGIQFLLSPSETIELAMDKLATYRTLNKIGLPCPYTFEIIEREDAVRTVGFPLILKPRYAGLKAVADYKIRKIGCEEELKEFLLGIEGKENQYVMQEYLEGIELTIDFFCDRDGEVLSVVPGERLSALSKAFSQDGGAIDQGRTFHDSQIEQLVCKAARNIRYFGPANFQAYRNKEGTIKFTENNPRFTGATVMTRAAGRDFFQWSIDLISGKKISLPQEDFKDISMSSWLSPIFFHEIKMLST